MLDSFIIDAIRREEAERARDSRSRIWLEIPELPRRPAEDEPEEESGPVVIPLYPEDTDEEDAA